MDGTVAPTAPRLTAHHRLNRSQNHSKARSSANRIEGGRPKSPGGPVKDGLGLDRASALLFLDFSQAPMAHHGPYTRCTLGASLSEGSKFWNVDLCLTPGAKVLPVLITAVVSLSVVVLSSTTSVRRP